MHKLYNLFYILNSFDAGEKEEILIDFSSLNEFDSIINELPEYEPPEEILEKIFRFV